ncbi:MAG: hypothetical protein JWN85_2151 [Gammaproteobacteria bacterium]|nr:hypothetical protein [Gammaproteobacteria bacterium]
MNQREDNPGSADGDRGRETNGGRDFYPGSHGFDDSMQRAYGGRGSSGREGPSRQGQNPPGQYERDQYAQGQHWNSGFGQRHDQQRHEPDRSGYGGSPGWSGDYGGGADELGYGANEGRYGHEQRHMQYEQRSNEQGRGGYGRQRAYGPGGGSSGPGGQYGRSQYRQESSTGRFPRDPYGHEHSSERLFGREPFRRDDEPRYYGTGAPGQGGPGFTGGAYAYGDGPPDRPRLSESEYSDESSLSYGRGYRGGGGGSARYGGFGAPLRSSPFPRGPKGYQRSDERLKEDISERLMEAAHIDSSEVTVEVRGAKVVLEGVVPDRHMKHAIEDLVDACPGVQDIDNRVRVGSAAERQGQGQGGGALPASSGNATTQQPSAGSAATTSGGVAGASGTATGTANGSRTK